VASVLRDPATKIAGSIEQLHKTAVYLQQGRALLSFPQPHSNSSVIVRFISRFDGAAVGSIALKRFYHPQAYPVRHA
jgi:hypothetical protein